MNNTITPIEEVFRKSFNIDFDPFIKFAFIVFLLGYLIFAFLILRQVNLMTSVLGTNLSPFLKAFAWLHLFVAVIILLVSFVA